MTRLYPSWPTGYSLSRDSAVGLPLRNRSAKSQKATVELRSTRLERIWYE
jgi:hypothetical protein